MSFELTLCGQHIKLTWHRPSSQVRELCLHEARRSVVDQRSGRVRCKVCGTAFASYASLSQHLGAQHGGINSEDVKFGLVARPELAVQTPPIVVDSLDSFPALSSSVASSGQQQLRKATLDAAPASLPPPLPFPPRRAPITLADLLSAAENSHGHRLPASPRRAAVAGTALSKHAAAHVECKRRNGGVAWQPRSAMEIPAGLRLKGAQRKSRMTRVKQQVRACISGCEGGHECESPAAQRLSPHTPTHCDLAP